MCGESHCGRKLSREGQRKGRKKYRLHHPLRKSTNYTHQEVDVCVWAHMCLRVCVCTLMCMDWLIILMINWPKEQAPSPCSLTLCDIVMPFVHLRSDWSLCSHLWHTRATATSSVFYPANATDSPQIICLSDMWEPDTQTVSKSIKPQHWWQIEVMLNYDCCSEVITHRALAKMLWRSSVAISFLWRADLDPAPSPLRTTVKSSCGWEWAAACFGET